MGYQFIEHAAELRIRLEAESMEGLLQSALEAVKNLLVESEPKPGQGQVYKAALSLEASSPEELLVHWINEICFWIQYRHFYPGQPRFKIFKDGTVLEAEIEGRIFESLPLTREIKSATYHDLKIESKEGRFKAAVIVDV